MARTDAGPNRDTGAKPSPPWRVEALSHRVPYHIPLGTVEEPVDGFPVAIVRRDDDVLAAALAEGNGVRLVLEPEGTPLPHEVEVLDAARPLLVAWVRLPRVVPDRETRFDLYVGGTLDPGPSGAVWADDFLTVLHLGDVPTANPNGYRNSSGALHGTGGAGDPAAVPTRVDGVLGSAQHFDGAGQHITLERGAQRAEGTLAHWFRAERLEQRILYYESDQTGRGFDGFTTALSGLEFHSGLDPASDGGPFGIWHQDGSDASTYRVFGDGPVGEWVHVAHTWDAAGEALLYVNGVEVGRTDVSTLELDGRPASFVAVGRAPNGERTWLGDVDELRVSGVARSAAWIAASYENQRDPESFFAVGEPEARP